MVLKGCSHPSLGSYWQQQSLLLFGHAKNAQADFLLSSPEGILLD